MAYNPYGGHPYGAPPNYNPYPGAGRGHPGFGPPPGMSSAPGMAPPPGVLQPPSATQANRPSGLPPSFQPPPNLPNINFNAPVIRLGGAGGASSLPARPNAPTGPSSWRDPDSSHSAGGPMRHDYGRHDRGGGGGSMEQGGRGGAAREAMHSLSPPTNDEKLRTIFVHKVPPSLGSGQALENLLSLVGRLRRWDSEISHLSDQKGEVFGFAQYEDADSLESAIELLKGVEVPLKKQEPRDPPSKETNGTTEGSDSDGKERNKDENEGETGDSFDGIDKVPLQVAVDPVSLQYIEAHKASQSSEAAAEAAARRDANKEALKAAIRNLFYPPKSEVREADGDVKMTDVNGLSGDGVEVLNIPLAQDDELADIPAEMREIVASEIASFRERSNQRDMERLKREQELEEQERRRNGEMDHPRASHADSPAHLVSSNNIPLGPRGGGGGGGGGGGSNNNNSAALPRGAARGVNFVNGNGANGKGEYEREDSVDTDASDEEIVRREMRKHSAEEEAMYKEAERKWVNRERQRAAALEREKDRDRAESENAVRHREEQLEREKNWDDEREASRKSSLYFRDHAAWLRKRAHDRAEEEARDAADRRAEKEELRRQAVEMEAARGMADSFLAQQAEGMERAQEREEERRVKEEKEKAMVVNAASAGSAAAAAAAAAAAPQRVTISFGAAAQRAQAQRGGATRRTVAEVEGLLDDEEQEATAKRRLVPIKFEPMSASASMTDEEINQAVRALAQEIPTERDGLWAWPVQWDYMDDAVIRDKLRPFVEKKVVEYLGVQEQFLVEVVEEHLRRHGRPEALVEDLQEALDEAAEDLVKKLWRMIIFFTESEKRGLPA